MAFDIFTPIVIGVPGLTAPAPNSTVLILRPTFTIANAPRSGPAGNITYLIELADGDSFANKVATWTAAETPNQTNMVSPVDLSYGKVYYWHARAYDSTTLGPWTNTQAFQMLAEPAPVFTPGPGPTGPAPNDAINLNSVIVHNSPVDVARWPATTTLSRLDLMPSGAHVVFDRQSSWPEVVPPGWAGGLQYTLWIVLNINGQWHASGCIEYWRGLYESGGPVTGYAQDWYYDPIRWGPMAGHQPAPGEQLAGAGGGEATHLIALPDRPHVDQDVEPLGRREHQRLVRPGRPGAPEQPPSAPTTSRRSCSTVRCSPSAVSATRCSR